MIFSTNDDVRQALMKVKRFSAKNRKKQSEIAFIQEEFSDQVVREAPLQLQVQGHDFAVLMRTPGDDKELGLGLLFSEGIIAGMRDIRSVAHCERVLDPEGEDNVLQVVLNEHVKFDLRDAARNLFSSSSCGVCGKAAIEQLLPNAMRQSQMQGEKGGDGSLIENRNPIELSKIMGAVSSLRLEQTLFKNTGGSHAAALYSFETGSLQLLKCFEDIGRHNACDKVLGWALQKDLMPLKECMLVLSSRIAFELVQKALMAEIPLVAALSAPSSLAVRLAHEAGITLLGFVQDERVNVYSHSERIMGF